ncbi:MAG: PQQ-binding-like beta-propeller repeat protein [Phycisphaerae bacterium]|nr:PQQ-binding-like beta-propeller repeat protein [Phycisphaerae bacterium]
MRRTPSALAVLAAIVVAPFAVAAPLGDWSNLGGNECRNGLVDAVGPATPSVRWSGAPNSVIAWSPAVEGNRLFVVRQTGFVPSGVPNESKVYAIRVSDGAPLWNFATPYVSGDWTTNVYGVSNGKVYVGRGGNGSSVSAPVYCLNAETGAIVWTSAEEVATGAYDGVVFADNGDPIFATHLYVRRVSALDGSTVWNTVRSCSVSGDCGPARSGNALYIDEVGPGGQVLTRLDIDTGQKLYSSPVMPGFLSQNTPMCGPNGMVFYARTQSNQAVDFFYAWKDTGTAFEFVWKEAAIAGAGSQHGITPDGGVVMLGFNGKLQKRDQATGALLAESLQTVTAQITQSHVAVDQEGTIFYGNGGFPGTIYSFNPDLSLRWSLPVVNLNQGGPVLTGDGTLLVAGTSTNFTAYYTEPACAAADLDCDGSVGPKDLSILLGAWGTRDADLNNDGTTDSADLGILLGAWG